MTVSATEGIGVVTQASTQSTAAPNQMDKDLFLKLMVAQLRNQSPMNPMDSAEFLAQSAQFTTIEKLTEVAEATAQAYAAQMAFGASTLAGKEVSYLDAEGVEASGLVDSVRFTGTGPMLAIGDTEVSINNVLGVVAAEPEPAVEPQAEAGPETEPPADSTTETPADGATA